MKLVELDSSFVAEDGRRGVAVQFRCPGCQKERIVIPFANPLDGKAPDPSMNFRGVLWTRSGETLETLTLTPSVAFAHVNGGYDGMPRTDCHWHGWVRNGETVDA